jgi:glutamyl/glutaminyl-tRNA synthetase
MVENGELDFFYKVPEIKKEKLVFKNSSLEKIKENLKEVLYALEEISESDFTENKIKEILMKIADGKESRGEVLHPIRYALSGLDRSPDPFIIASILGKDETISRLQKAIE